MGEKDRGSGVLVEKGRVSGGLLERAWALGLGGESLGFGDPGLATVFGAIWARCMWCRCWRLRGLDAT